MLGKDVEDQCRAVDDLDLEVVLQIAQLGGGEFIVKEDDVQLQFFAQLAQLLNLAGTDVGGRVDALQILVRSADDLHPCRISELFQLIQGILEIEGPCLTAHLHANHECAFTNVRNVSGRFV